MIQAKYTESQNLIVVTWSNITANEPCAPHQSRAQPTLVAVQAEGVWGNALTPGTYNIALDANRNIATLTNSLFPIDTSGIIYPNEATTTHFVMEIF